MALTYRADAAYTASSLRCSTDAFGYHRRGSAGTLRDAPSDPRSRTRFSGPAFPIVEEPDHDKTTRTSRSHRRGRSDRLQPVILQLLEITQALPALKGVVMELEDCAFPLLQKIVTTDDATVAFRDVDIALLVGARPRSKGMERKDLLEANAQIFTAQGRALDEAAARAVKVLVVGNPANTNAPTGRIKKLLKPWTTSLDASIRVRNTLLRPWILWAVFTMTQKLR